MRRSQPTVSAATLFPAARAPGCQCRNAAAGMPVTWDLPPVRVILLGMDTSPVSPDDIRAAAEAHEELGPDYHDAVVASFVDRVEREVDARVRARLAAMHQAAVAPVHRAEVAPLRRGTLLKGMALGAGAGALVALAATGLGGAHPGVYLPHFRSHQPPGTIHVLPVIRSKTGTGFLQPPVQRITVSPPKS
jgi:hypothetical protein